jgi:hypothetical protein
MQVDIQEVGPEFSDVCRSALLFGATAAVDTLLIVGMNVESFSPEVRAGVGRAALASMAGSFVVAAETVRQAIHCFRTCGFDQDQLVDMYE